MSRSGPADVFWRNIDWTCRWDRNIPTASPVACPRCARNQGSCALIWFMQLRDSGICRRNIWNVSAECRVFGKPKLRWGGQPLVSEKCIAVGDCNFFYLVRTENSRNKDIYEAWQYLHFWLGMRQHMIAHENKHEDRAGNFSAVSI